MGLSYHFRIAAPVVKTPADLESFLQTVEVEAKKLGFDPVMVLNAKFDSDERRAFARRLTRGFILEDERLKGVVAIAKNQVWNHDPVSGYCRLIPEHGVILVLTDERQCETVFGFFRYPPAVLDLNQREIMKSGTAGRWVFEDFVDSPDHRYRQIVKMFADAGYVEAEKDEFAGCKLPPPH